MNKKRFFHSDKTLQECINAYFEYIKGSYRTELIPSKKNPEELIENIVWNREAEPATLSGLAFFLGFESRQKFDKYEQEGKFAKTLKRGRLRIEAEYEKKLHYTSSTGAIFALKSLGWNERETMLPILNGNLKIEIIDNGIPLASSETEIET